MSLRCAHALLLAATALLCAQCATALNVVTVNYNTKYCVIEPTEVCWLCPAGGGFSTSISETDMTCACSADDSPCQSCDYDAVCPCMNACSEQQGNDMMGCSAFSPVTDPTGFAKCFQDAGEAATACFEACEEASPPPPSPPPSPPPGPVPLPEPAPAP
mmetsp:Transcript_2042/g.5930  ORF Transcript_2042/g.5930 Transcript_2042/m.5930 type:complete len:159 (+) Transcript_2042:200-676(+)